MPPGLLATPPPTHAMSGLAGPGPSRRPCLPRTRWTWPSTAPAGARPLAPPPPGTTRGQCRAPPRRGARWGAGELVWGAIGVGWACSSATSVEPHAAGHRHLHEPRSLLHRDRRAKGLGQLLARVDLLRGHAVGLGHGGDVEAGEVEPRKPLGLLEFGEPLEDHVLLVAHDEERHGDPVGGGRPQRRDPVLRRALAEHAH